YFNMLFMKISFLNHDVKFIWTFPNILLRKQVFFDPTALTFLETVILGGSSHEVEKLFAEDSGFFPDLLGHTVTSLEFTGFNSDTQTDGGQQHSTPRDQMPVIGNQQSTVSLFTGESTSGGKHAALSSVHEKGSDGECVAATDRRKSMSVKTGRHRISWANLDESKCADHLTVDSDLLSTNMKRSLMLPWRLSTSTSFLSYTTETAQLPDDQSSLFSVH
ncbi:calcium-activated potassium channel alpha subunit, partial [Clonorchis sinensis]